MRSLTSTQGRATDEDLKALVLWQFSESLSPPGWGGIDLVMRFIGSGRGHDVFAQDIIHGFVELYSERHPSRI